jgi:hypothetical protein
MSQKSPHAIGKAQDEILEIRGLWFFLVLLKTGMIVGKLFQFLVPFIE